MLYAERPYTPETHCTLPLGENSRTLLRWEPANIYSQATAKRKQQQKPDWRSLPWMKKLFLTESDTNWTECSQCSQSGIFCISLLPSIASGDVGLEISRDMRAMCKALKSDDDYISETRDQRLWLSLWNAQHLNAEHSNCFGGKLSFCGAMWKSIVKAIGQQKSREKSSRHSLPQPLFTIPLVNSICLSEKYVFLPALCVGRWHGNAGNIYQEKEWEIEEK